MKKKHIPLLALLLASQLYPQSKMDINNLIDMGGLLYAPNKEKPFSGSVFDLYDNGQKKLNGRYRNGIKNGKWQWWNMDGGIDSTGSYKKGLMNGLWEFYFSNGNLKGKGQYRNGNGAERDDTSIARDGRHGKWTFWYESGVLKEKQNWKNGKLDGLSTTWHENGQKKVEGTYKDGELDGIWISWNEQGQKVWEGTLDEYEAEQARFAAEAARKAEEAKLAAEAAKKAEVEQANLSILYGRSIWMLNSSLANCQKMEALGMTVERGVSAINKNIFIECPDFNESIAIKILDYLGLQSSDFTIHIVEGNECGHYFEIRIYF